LLHEVVSFSSAIIQLLNDWKFFAEKKAMTRLSFSFLRILSSFALLVSLANCQTSSCRQQQNQPAQPVCECTKLDECLKNQREQTNKFETECRQACSTHLGPNSTAVLDCLSAFETEKINNKISMDKCMNDIAGRPCIRNDNESGAEKTYVFNSSLIAETLAADRTMMQQKLALVKNHPQMNAYKRCFKTCIKQVKLASQPTSTGKTTKLPNCYVQTGCQIENDPAKKSLRKLAKSNCAMQTKIDKTSMKLKLAECLQSAFTTPAELTPKPVCPKPHTNEL
jgi:hypothetical protein